MYFLYINYKYLATVFIFSLISTIFYINSSTIIYGKSLFYYTYHIFHLVDFVNYPAIELSGHQVVEAQVDGQVSPIILFGFCIRDLIDDDELASPSLFQRVYFDLLDPVHVLKNLIFQIEEPVMDLILLPHMFLQLLRQGQSIAHINVSHADEIACLKRTIYSYKDKGVFEARNTDPPALSRWILLKVSKEQTPVF